MTNQNPAATSPAERVDAKILIQVNEAQRGINFQNIDLDTNRNALALQVGLRVVDMIFAATEEAAE